MSSDIQLYVSAFLVGLLGAGHCIAMCGSIACAVGLSGPTQTQSQAIIRISLFNLGRILSYSIAGAIVSGSAATLIKLGQLESLLWLLRLLAAILLIFLGLSIGQWNQSIKYIEKIGASLWRRIQPHASRLLANQRHSSAFSLGLLWGWLPCGLVYSMLTWSATQASVISGAIIMFSFGLGTFATIFTTSIGAQSLNEYIKSTAFRKISAIALILFGVYHLYVLLES